MRKMGTRHCPAEAHVMRARCIARGYMRLLHRSRSCEADISGRSVRAQVLGRGTHLCMRWWRFCGLCGIDGP